MSTYRSSLPGPFPHQWVCTHNEIKLLVEKLIFTERNDVDNWSSFAVTADAAQGYAILWLSDASNKFLFGEDHDTRTS